MKHIILLFILLTLNSSLSTAKSKNLKQGVWRTEFKLNDKSTLPFTLEYSKKTKSIVATTTPRTNK